VEPTLPPYLPPGAVLLRRDLVARGADPDEIARDLRVGMLVRVRRGAYTDVGTWRAAGPEQRHLLAARAAAAAMKPPVVLSHTSAALAWGLPVWGVDLDAVHVTRPVRASARREAGVVHHQAALPRGHVLERDGLRVTSPARTVVDLARLAGFEPGVVTADAALHQKLVTPDDLLVMANELRDWPGSRAVGRAVSFADGLAETVGESRSRVLCHRFDLPTPRLQVEIRRDGVLLGRVDMLIDEWKLVLEFDGRLKYRLDGSTEPERLEGIVWAEKVREDSIRGEGYGVFRIIWPDFSRPAATAERIRRAGMRALGR
jgi:hypothetical protein